MQLLVSTDPPNRRHTDPEGKKRINNKNQIFKTKKFRKKKKKKRQIFGCSLFIVNHIRQKLGTKKHPQIPDIHTLITQRLGEKKTQKNTPSNHLINKTPHHNQHK